VNPLAEEFVDMSSHMAGRLREEADLIARFTDSYRRRFSSIIDQMNRGESPESDLAGLRLCVEAVDMMLASQKQLCKALSEMS
jgi:hypothetical protein